MLLVVFACLYIYPLHFLFVKCMLSWSFSTAYPEHNHHVKPCRYAGELRSILHYSPVVRPSSSCTLCQYTTDTLYQYTIFGVPLSSSLLCSGKALVVCSSFLEIYLPLLKHLCYVCGRRRRNQVDMQGHIHLLRQVHILEKAILHHLQQDMQQPLLIQKFLQGPL